MLTQHSFTHFHTYHAHRRPLPQPRAGVLPPFSRGRHHYIPHPIQDMPNRVPGYFPSQLLCPCVTYDYLALSRRRTSTQVTCRSTRRAVQ
ncbi:hypothetical protein OG21DRAFT_1066901 [Imleria badia]|nr:hypothetical protein OG21DRAFT_1066901 [Imleria badia]